MGARSTIVPLLLAGIAAAGLARADTPGAFPHLEAWPASLALAGTTEALGEGIEAALQNPAGMLHPPARGAAFSHSSLFEGGLVRHQAAALCWTRHESGAVYDRGRFAERRGAIRSAYALGITNLSGDLPGAETYGELQISLSYARRVPHGLRSGFRIRYAQARSSVDGTGGDGIAFDLGLEGTLLGCRAGGVARALFSEIRWDRSLDGPVPRGFDLGLSRPLPFDLTLFAGAALRDAGEPRRIALAAEWSRPGLPLRLRVGPAWRDTGGKAGTELSAGVGLEAGAFAADYGMRTHPSGLGEIHRFGLRAALP